MSQPKGLTRLCALSEVAEDEPCRVELDGFAYAVFEVDGAYFVTADECTHGPGSLSEGHVENFEVECPFHQGRFDIRTGQPTLAPCEVALRVWEAVVHDGAVMIDPAAPKRP